MPGFRFLRLLVVLVALIKKGGRWLASTQDELGEGIEFDRLNRDNPLTGDGLVVTDRLYVYRDGDRHLMPLENANFEKDLREAGQVPLFEFGCDGGICGV